MKTTAFWDITPCSLFGIDGRFRGTYCLHHQGELSFITLMMEAVAYTYLKCRSTPRPHGATSQKGDIFILDAVRT
jgi:hypothetical protein